MKMDSSCGFRSLNPWIKGGSWSVEPEGDGRGGPLFRGVSIPECPWSWYDPTQEAKTAYIEYAGIGKKLWSDTRVETSNEIQLHFLDFVENYGPISISKPFELKASPDGPPLVPKEGITFSLSDAADQAKLLAWALACYQGIEDPREWDSEFAVVLVEGKTDLAFILGSLTHDYANLDLNLGDSQESRLSTLMNGVGMKGVSPGIYFDESGYWGNAYQYDSLAAAMWLQLHQVVLQGVPLRRCRGCDVLFEAKGNQFYCDALCRGRANARSSYRTKKGMENNERLSPQAWWEDQEVIDKLPRIHRRGVIDER